MILNESRSIKLKALYVAQNASLTVILEWEIESNQYNKQLYDPITLKPTRRLRFAEGAM